MVEVKDMMKIHQPSLATGKPAFSLIPTGLILVFVVADMVSGWWIWLGGVTKCCDPRSTGATSGVTICVRRRFKQMNPRQTCRILTESYCSSLQSYQSFSTLSL